MDEMEWVVLTRVTVTKRGKENYIGSTTSPRINTEYYVIT